MSLLLALGVTPEPSVVEVSWLEIVPGGAPPSGFLAAWAARKVKVLGSGVFSMYPINAASPERLDVGAVVQISDGAVQTSGVSIKVKPQSGAAAAGGGTITYEEGIVAYVPTQAETNYTSFQVIAYKTGCIPAAVTVITTASAVAGYAGLDWGVMTQKTATNALTNTSIASVSGAVGSVTGFTPADVTTILADTNDIQTRLPAALVSGRMDSSVGAMAAGVLTATAIAADAITDAKVAADVTIASVTGAVGSVTGAVGSVTGAVGSVTGNVGGNVTGSVASVVGAVGSVTAMVTANTIQISGDSIAADNAEAFFDGTGYAGTGNVIPTVTTLTGHTPQTGDSFARIGATGSGLTSLATQASVNTIDDFLDTEIAAIKAKTDNLPAAPAAVGDIPTASAIADQVWDEVLAGHLTAGSTGNALNAAGAAGDPWTTALPGAYGAGTAGNIVGNRIDAAITSRLAPTVAARTLDVSITGEAGIDWANIGSPTTAVNLSATNIDVDQVVASVSGNIGGSVYNVVSTVDANVISASPDALASDDFDTTYYGAMAGAIWNALLITYAADGSLGEAVGITKAKTNNLPVAPAAVGDIPTAVQNADALLNRDMSLVSDTNARTPLMALRFLRNKWSISGTALTVTKEDDATSAWTAVVTAAPGADPISGNDPT